MCGIAGQFSFERKVNIDEIKNMTECLFHRGPDDKGYFVKDNIGLGFRRLSTIDLLGGNQPIFNEDHTLCIIFNGEIYNYRYLKKRLVDHKFKTETDTEVALHLFEEYGVESFGLLNGMFSLVIYDIEKNTIYCARDRFGQKPFNYFYVPQKQFIFASEISALLVHDEVRVELNESNLSFYFFYNFIPAPYSIFKNIFKLPPQSYMIVNSNGIKIEQYKVSEQNLEFSNLVFDEIIEKTDFLLEKAIERHLIADVDVGLFLSGGLDSTTVLKYAIKVNPEIKCFSAVFGNYINESDYFNQTVKKYGGDSYVIDVVPEYFEIEDIISCYSEPLGDSAIIPTYLISRFASKHVKVVLTGEGGDEVFGGYDRYRELSRTHFNWYSILKPLLNGRLPKRKDIKQEYIYLKSRFLAPKNLKERYLDLMAFNKIEHMKLNYNLDIAELNKYIEDIGINCVEDIIFHEQKHRLPDNLFQKVDIASMANSLEARCPFLDHELVNFLNSLPLNRKVTSQNNKIILKHILSKDFSSSFINRPKRGFGAPVWKWMKDEKYRKPILSLFNNNKDALIRIIKPGYLKKLVRNLKSNNITYEHWKVLVLLVWLKGKGISL